MLFSIRVSKGKVSRYQNQDVINNIFGIDGYDSERTENTTKNYDSSEKSLGNVS